MQGPTQPREQARDPRESTVVMPRTAPPRPVDPVSGARADGAALTEPPEFGDPYALPSWQREPEPPPAPAADHRTTEPAQPPAEPGPHPLAAEPAQHQPAAETPAEPADETGSAQPPTEPAADQPADEIALGQPPTEAASADPATAEADAAEPAPVRPPAEPSPGAAAAGQAGAARLTAGSIADLRARLTRLPHGHPSALYDEAGRVRPAPTRLRQLELGLPAPERSAPAGLAGRPERLGFEPHDTEPAEASGIQAADDHEAVSVAGNGGAALADRIAGPAADHSAAHPDSNGQHGPRTDWQDPYALGANSGEVRNGARPGDPLAAPWPAADVPEGANGADVANGHRQLAREPEPDRQPDAGSPSLPLLDTGPRGTTRNDTVEFDTRQLRAPRQPAETKEGARRSQGERPARNGVLAPQHRELVGRIMAACRAAEGRSVFGSYGSSGLTPALRRIAAQLPAGGLAAGSENDTLKPADRLAAKLARLIDRQPGRAPEELAASIGDVIRYAFTFTPADYSEGTWLVHRKLKAQGFELEARRNRWDSPEYKGVFTRWRDPAHGVAFEVLFHTIESWAVVKQTHAAYVRITDPATPPAERARLRTGQVAAAAAVQSPPGWMDIADYRSAAP